MSDLEILKQHRDALLLAEVAAWLHDDFKHTDGHIKQYVSGAPAPSGRQDTEDLIPNQYISLLGTTQAFKDARKRQRNTILPDYLNRCHYAAHIEKQDANSQQSYPAYISSPFGFEGSTIPANLTQDLRQRVPWTRIGASPFTYRERFCLEQTLRELFSRVGGDTRRSTNEVPLWDWSHIVAALYKSALAGALLGYTPAANDLRWRLLSVRVNAARFLDSMTRVPDLLARRELLDNAFERVRQLLEETYPLGTRVYQDENGSIYVVPNLANLLSLQDIHGNTLEQLICQEFAEGAVKNDSRLKLAGELIPEIYLDKKPWWAQSPGRYPRKDETPPIGAILSQNPDSSTSPDFISQIWQNATDEICPVCRLRPQGPSQKARDRKVCDVCEQRRADRAESWKAKLDTTIWLDEVADANGRLALIVGCFGLERWLDGTMVQTLLVNEPKNGGAVTKNPTFARLRRIWETTRKFWNEIQTEATNLLKDDRRRLQLWIDPSPSLFENHVYEIEVGETVMSVMWVKNQSDAFLLSIDNLGYIAKQLRAPKETYSDPALAAIFVEDYIQSQFLANGKLPKLWNPDQPGRKNLLQGKKIVKTAHQDVAYATTIPLLAEPRTFMALVPADRALKVIEAIRRKYEVEMGKVRNRLSITLGAVFFPRKTPLAAAIESGRRMLAFQAQSQVWKVQSVVQKNDPNAQDHHRKQTVELTLTRDGRDVKLSIPVMMGDGTTLDVWYPYWRVRSKHSKGRWFKFTGGCWAHVCELQKDDFVRFTPSTFDFEYLDTTARRFEVTYQHGQRRDSAKRQRPYLLEELDGLNAAWEAAQRLSKSQIYALDALIERKRQEWGKPIGLEALRLPADDPFRQLVRDALRETGLSLDLESAALRGWLRDALELHLEILKE